MNTKKIPEDGAIVYEKQKRKKNKILEVPQNEQTPSKPKKNKKSKKSKLITVDMIENEPDQYIDDDPAQIAVATNQLESAAAGKSTDEDGQIHWPEQDLVELFRRIEACIPDKDTLSYSTRVEKLHWDEVR